MEKSLKPLHSKEQRDSLTTTTTTSLNPKFLGSAMDPQQISQGQPHIFFFLHSIQYEVIFSITSLIDKSFFVTSSKVILGLPLLLFISPTWINLLFLTSTLITLQRYPNIYIYIYIYELGYLLPKKKTRNTQKIQHHLFN